MALNTIQSVNLEVCLLFLALTASKIYYQKTPSTVKKESIESKKGSYIVSLNGQTQDPDPSRLILIKARPQIGHGRALAHLYYSSYACQIQYLRVFGKALTRVKYSSNTCPVEFLRVLSTALTAVR